MHRRRLTFPAAGIAIPALLTYQTATLLALSEVLRSGPLTWTWWGVPFAVDELAGMVLPMSALVLWVPLWLRPEAASLTRLALAAGGFALVCTATQAFTFAAGFVLLGKAQAGDSLPARRWSGRLVACLVVGLAMQAAVAGGGDFASLTPGDAGQRPWWLVGAALTAVGLAGQLPMYPWHAAFVRGWSTQPHALWLWTTLTLPATLAGFFRLFDAVWGKALVLDEIGVAAPWWLAAALGWTATLAAVWRAPTPSRRRWLLLPAQAMPAVVVLPVLTSDALAAIVLICASLALHASCFLVLTNARDGRLAGGPGWRRLSTLSLLGLPGGIGFLALSQAVRAGATASAPWPLTMLAVGQIVTCVVACRVLAAEDRTALRLSSAQSAIAGFLLALIVGTGVMPQLAAQPARVLADAVSMPPPADLNLALSWAMVPALAANVPAWARALVFASIAWTATLAIGRDIPPFAERATRRQARRASRRAVTQARRALPPAPTDGFAQASRRWLAAAAVALLLFLAQT